MGPSLNLYIIDGVTGNILHQMNHPNAVPPVTMLSVEVPRAVRPPGSGAGTAPAVEGGGGAGEACAGDGDEEDMGQVCVGGGGWG